MVLSENVLKWLHASLYSTLFFFYLLYCFLVFINTYCYRTIRNMGEDRKGTDRVMGTSSKRYSAFKNLILYGAT